MGGNADGTYTTGGGHYHANKSSQPGGVFGTDPSPSSRAPRRPSVTFDMDRLERAENRDAAHMQQMQAQQQQQMQMQRQMQMQQQQQQQQQHMQMQQQQQQMQMAQSRQAPSPPSNYDHIRQKNSAASFSLGSDTWDGSLESSRGGKARRGVTSKQYGGFAKSGSSPPGRGDAGPAAGSYVRERVLDRFNTQAPGGGGRGPGGASSISLGSDAWDGSAASPRSNKALMGRGMPQAPPMQASSMPAAGGAQRYDIRAHLGSNVCFG